MSAPTEFTYSAWRHGGWYVNDVHYASGAVGCVSRNYADRKWRIACDPRPFETAPTFKCRDDAAHAEWLLARAEAEQLLAEGKAHDHNGRIWALDDRPWRIERDGAVCLSATCDRGKRVKYQFVVTVECETQVQADQVMAERLGHDDDYGFVYNVDWITS